MPCQKRTTPLWVEKRQCLLTCSPPPAFPRRLAPTRCKRCYGPALGHANGYDQDDLGNFIKLRLQRFFYKRSSERYM